MRLADPAYHGTVSGSSPRLRILGIPVQVSASGIIGILVLAYLWVPSFERDGGQPAAWVLATAFAVLLSVATLLHEMAHALLARHLGYPVHGVVLQLMGGVTHYERRRESPLAEAAIAASGPAATFGVAGASWIVAGLVEPGGVAWILAQALLWANVVMGLYNSLPGLPLDGGQVLRALVWAASGSERRGTQVAAWVGRGVAVMTLLIPLVLAQLLGAQADLLLFVLAGLLAAMLWAGATAQLRAAQIRDRAEGLSAGSMARRAIPVDRDLPLAEAIRRASAVGAGALVVVDGAGTPTAIGQPDAIAAVPPNRRPWVSVGSVARPLGEGSQISQEVSGSALLGELASRGRDELLVVDGSGLVYGVLVLSDVEAALRR